jgi:predicted PurR-regulated permease PerM
MQLKYRKIPNWKLIPIIIIGIVFYKLADNAETIFNGLKSFLSVLSYLLWAFAIAYVLNPLMVFIERKLKIKRVLSILLIYVAFTGFIAFAITILAPILASSLTQLFQNFPDYVQQTQTWAEGKIETFKFIDDKYNMENYLKSNLDGIFETVSGLLSSFIRSIFSNVLNLTSFIFKLILAVTISIYLLYDKESLILTFKKILQAFLNKKDAERLISVGKRTNDIFSRYFVGKILGAALVGSICFIVLFILHVPYPFLISLIVGILNLIPYFGTILGIIPAVLITLFIDPMKALWVFIFLMILGQIDGMVISPKILGDKTGISPILIMVAITIGGALYGVVGMFVAVPITAVLKSFFLEYINKRLESKKELEDQA